METQKEAGVLGWVLGGQNGIDFRYASLDGSQLNLLPSVYKKEMKRLIQMVGASIQEVKGHRFGKGVARFGTHSAA